MQVILTGEHHQQAPILPHDPAKLRPVQSRRDREHEIEGRVLVRDEAIGICHHPLAIGIALRGCFDRRNGDVDAVPLVPFERREPKAVAATDVEDFGVRRQRCRFHERQSGSFAAALQIQPSPRRDHLGGIAGRFRPALVRLQQIHIPAAGNVERVAARANVALRFALQRDTAVANGAEKHAYNHIMHRSTRRLLTLTVGFVAVLLVSALLYRAGMGAFESKPRTFAESLEWASETLSTTGYGHDNHWSHPLMVLLVVVVQFIGVFIVVLIVPIILIPYLEERFEGRVPRTPGNISDHVVVFRFGPAVETLLQRLRASGVPTLVVETDEKAARAVLEARQRVVFARVEEDALAMCALPRARAIVANGRDQENAAIVLRARQSGFRGEILAFVENPAHRKPIELAGATAAYTPRHIVAAALAAHASDVISPRLPGFDAVEGVSRCEVRIAPDSPVVGKNLGQLKLGDSGAIVVGCWNRSRLDSRCTSDARIAAGSILELVGEHEALERAFVMLDTRPLRRSGPFLIAGFGEVGRKVHELLTDAGEEVRVIERQPGPGVDVVGNVLDPSTLERAGITETRAAVFALDSDDSMLFAAVISRDMAPDVPVIARVNHASNIENIYRAGADYALSISDVSGEIVSARLLRKHARPRDEHRAVMRAVASTLAGRALRDSGIRAHGCSLLAIRRGGAWITRLGPDTMLEAGDELFLCGMTDAVRELTKQT